MLRVLSSLLVNSSLSILMDPCGPLQKGHVDRGLLPLSWMGFPPLLDCLWV